MLIELYLLYKILVFQICCTIIILSILSSHTIYKISIGSIQISLSNLPINLIWTLDQFHTIEKFYIHKNLQESRKEKNLEDAKRDGKNHINSTIHPRPASSEASIPSGGLHYDLTRSSQYLLTALITFNNRKQHEKYPFINTILLPHKKPQFSCKFAEYAYESKTTNLT